MPSLQHLPLLPLLLLLGALALSAPRSASGARFPDNNNDDDDLLYGGPIPGHLEAGHTNQQPYSDHYQQQQQQQTSTTESSSLRGGRRARFALQDEVKLLAFGLLQLGQGVRELSERTARRLAEAQGAVERAAAAALGAERRAGDAERTADGLRERLGRLEEAWAPARTRAARRDEAEESYDDNDDLAPPASPSKLSEQDVEPTRRRMDSPRLRR